MMFRQFLSPNFEKIKGGESYPINSVSIHSSFTNSKIPYLEDETPGLKDASLWECIHLLFPHVEISPPYDI